MQLAVRFKDFTYSHKTIHKQSKTRSKQAQTNLREGKISSQRLPYFAQLLQFFWQFSFWLTSNVHMPFCSPILVLALPSSSQPQQEQNVVTGKRTWRQCTWRAETLLPFTQTLQSTWALWHIIINMNMCYRQVLPVTTITVQKTSLLKDSLILKQPEWIQKGCSQLKPIIWSADHEHNVI